MSRSRRVRRDIFANKNKTSKGKIVLMVCVAAVVLAGIGGWAYMLFDEENSIGFLALGGVKQPQAGGVFQPQPNIRTDDKTNASEPAAESAETTPDYSRFTKLYYFESDKLQRYLAYEASHRGFSSGEVVWRVNANLDKPFFSDVTVVDDPERLPLLLNKFNRLPDDYAPEELVEVGNGLLVTAETKDAFLKLAEAAKVDGYTLRPGSAYRTLVYQLGLYERYKKADGEEKADTYSARPGHSEHHTGRTVDLVASDGSLTNFRGTEEAKWVAENAYKYGFIVRYTEENEEVTGYNNEPWHITYVGKNTAIIMHKQGFGSLEEYFVKCVDHREPH